jgi:hypothetical protein
MPKSKVYTQQAKKTIHTEAHKRVLAIGNKVEERAKENIQSAVYSTPEPDNYRRTGLAKASIQTVDKGNYVLVGANEPSFKEDASKLGVDVEVGGVTFYLPYIEKGHIMRNGEFYPARPFLVPALDWARQKWGR